MQNEAIKFLHRIGILCFIRDFSLFDNMYLGKIDKDSCIDYLIEKYNYKNSGSAIRISYASKILSNKNMLYDVLSYIINDARAIWLSFYLEIV